VKALAEHSVVEVERARVAADVAGGGSHQR
jgi:hypothetical protein